MPLFTVEFLETAEQLRQFVTEHGRLPNQCLPADTHERKLGMFLRNQRGYVAQPHRTTQGAIDRAEYLDKLVPTWRTDNRRPVVRRSRTTTFEKRVRQIIRFVRKNGHLPRAMGATDLERTLGRFLVNQRQAAKGRGTTAWSKGRHAYLDEMLPGWDAPHQFALAA